MSSDGVAESGRVRLRHDEAHLGAAPLAAFHFKVSAMKFEDVPGKAQAQACARKLLGIPPVKKGLQNERQIPLRDADTAILDGDPDHSIFGAHRDVDWLVV